MRTLAITLGISLGLVTAAQTATADKPTKLRRFAYVIGANDGGAERVKLRYAGTDAKKVARLLRDLGGVKSDDVVLKTPSSISEIQTGFDELVPRLQAARKSGARVELVIYYSGHSDERGLLVGENRLDYKDLRKKISSMPADVNIAVLDSCASGAFTRTKGGKKEPAFLVDESSKVTGYAFISSSSADEVAQESDRISASFFTHYLISGLRGGADANRDGRVTLSEAYQFAFAETVARTESTVGGAQHPAYNMHLAGTGDVIMTDLRATSASLIVAKAVRGRLFIRDAAGALVIELNKTGPHSVELGLSPGAYSVTLKKDGKLYRADIRLSANKKNTLVASAFGRAKLEKATARGVAPGAELVDDPVLEEDDEYVRESIRVSFLPHLGVGATSLNSSGKKTRTTLSLNILAGRGDALRGVQIGGLVNVMDDEVEGVQVAGLFNVNGSSSRGAIVSGLGNVVSGHHRGPMVAGAFNAVLGGGRGVAVGGVGNYTSHHYRGVMVAGTTNVSVGSVDGLQIAGVANYAEDVKGSQIGLVNVSTGRVTGLQVGLVNIAEESDTSIGLLNVVGNGYRAMEAWSSDTAGLSVGFKLGARLSYGIVAVGGDDDTIQAGAGFGVHSPMGRAYIDFDAMGFVLSDHDFNSLGIDLMAKLRLAVGFELTSELAIFGGPTATGQLYFDPPDMILPASVTPIGGREFVGDDVIFRLSPGLFGGVRLTL